MERYQHVVRYMMAGHTHRKYYQVTQSMSNPGKTIMLNNVGPSVTPYRFMNPGFQVIDLDAQTMLPINIQTYYMDVNKANLEGTPTWEICDDYKADYGVTDLSPASMKDLADRMNTDDDLAKTWISNKFRKGQPVPETLTEDDHLQEYCPLVSSEMHERQQCLDNNGA